MAEILENLGEILADGAKCLVTCPFSGYDWKWSVVHAETCWEVPEHPPAARLLVGLFLMEGEEKVIFPCAVAAGGRRKFPGGRKESQKLGCARLSAVLPGLLWLCLPCCAVQQLQHFKGLSDSVVLG